MNREKLRDCLLRLKNDLGAVCIKAEFEAEGSRMDELIMLRELVESAGLEMIIKVGGCEAVHDIDQCRLLNVSGVMAPMIETPFAMDKFRGAVARVYGEARPKERIINAETITCLRSFDEILEHGCGFLTGVTVGRSDLSASMGVKRADIESAPVFEATRELCAKAKDAGLVSNFGGSIGVESVPFIAAMCPYIDRFETRKVVMSKDGDEAFLRRKIAGALEFELQYLKFKSDFYYGMAREDSARIDRLESQLALIVQ